MLEIPPAPMLEYKRGVGGFCPMPYAQAQGLLNKNPHHTHPLGEYGAEIIEMLTFALRITFYGHIRFVGLRKASKIARFAKEAFA